MMRDEYRPPLTCAGELLLEPCELAGLDDAARAAAAPYQVEHDQPQRVADIPYIVQLLGCVRRRARLWLLCGLRRRPQTTDHLAEPELVAALVRGYPNGRPGERLFHEGGDEARIHRSAGGTAAA